MNIDSREITEEPNLAVNAAEAIEDYRICYRSRQTSLIGRREVLTGKAKFGIFGDGKELPQIAMAKVFQKGDIRSGYYRDQTFAFAKGISTVKQFFSQLYADPNLDADPFSAGRQMNSHFASRYLDDKGEWRDLTDMFNTTADGSPTASQMPRLAGLVQASKLYRILPELKEMTDFSHNGDEVAFGTIGNASCAEGQFWETINAVGVIQGPLIMSIWDDDYGISVPNEFQITKNSLSDMLAGFQRTEKERGFEIFTVKAWDYEGLIQTYRQAADIARNEHVPTIIHVIEVTQPQGHSTSGSHERYKSEERLKWERAFDCLLMMRSYLLERGFVTEEELEAWEKEDRKWVRQVKNEAWQEFQAPIKKDKETLISYAGQIASRSAHKEEIQKIVSHLKRNLEHSRRELLAAAQKILLLVRDEQHPAIEKLIEWRRQKDEEGAESYGSHLYSESPHSPFLVKEIKPEFDKEAPVLSGFEILNRAFHNILATDPRVIAFGEDVGKLGDVNQGFAGLQDIFGRHRVTDTGIRENTIMGQAVGLAQRGLRPIAEIQYLDYFIYGLQTLSDDLATLHYRTKGGQKAPAIIRTRGHRLEGIWHAGSPMGMLIHSLRGIHIAVPRNMTQAAGFYHTFLQGDDPAVIIEVLNGYRRKEKLPSNLYDITIPIGVPEVIRKGEDVTLVTYGACCRIAMEAAEELAQTGISVEIIDVRTLLPFDIHHNILDSLKKTNRIIFVDEDVPGGATAFMMQEVLEKQGGYQYLDSLPQTLCGTAHRPAYGDDGNYWSKPQVESIFRKVYEMMNEADPNRFRLFY